MAWGTSSSKKTQGSTGPGGAPLTKETQQLLNDVMQKRGLSLRAMQDVSDSMQRGDGKWADHLSTGTAAYRAPISQTSTTVKVPKFSGQSRAPAAMPPASFSGMRMASQIPKPEREQFVASAPAPDRNVEKDRLSKVMEHGAKKVKEMEWREQQLRLQPPKPAPKVDTREELIDQIVAEIQERREFLEVMQSAGKAGEYEAKTKGEIAQRLKELEKLGFDVKSSRPQKGKDPNRVHIG